MAFLDAWTELTGTLPGLSPFLAQKYISRAWLDICGLRNWSFLQSDASIVVPAVVSTGTVNVTQFSAAITFNAAASAALLAQTQVGATPGLAGMAFRVTSPASPQAGQVYTIISVDNSTPAAITAVLDRPLVEATSATATYQIYRAYIPPPDPNFLGWISVVDMTNAFKLRLDRSSAAFDAADPQRLSQGLAYYLGQYRGVSTVNAVTGATAPNPTQNAGTPLYELWPVPTQGQMLYARFRLRAFPYGDRPTDDLPAVVDTALVLQRALGWHAYPWAAANAASFPTMRGAPWPSLIQQARGQFWEAYTTANRRDNDQVEQAVLNRGRGLLQAVPFGRPEPGFPIDSNFIQSHLIRM